jgi:hypothetical protein
MIRSLLPKIFQLKMTEALITFTDPGEVNPLGARRMAGIRDV